MGTMLWAVDKLFGKTITAQTRSYLSRVVHEQQDTSRQRATSLLQGLASKPGPHVLFGETEWRQPVNLPLEYFSQAHSIITGGTGSGKTMAALLVIEALLEDSSRDVSFGICDPKGELFERTIYLIARKLQGLPPAQADRLRERIVMIDLASLDPVTSYNIAHAWQGCDLDYFANCRVETLQELLPSGDGFSLRGSSIVKHLIKLLAEHRLPFSSFNRVLSEESFRENLVDQSEDDETRYYFRHNFPSENRATVAAVLARLSSSLLGSGSLRLALSCQDAPDFRAFQDEGKIVLVNCAGQNISRSTARTLQALFLSDIRQAVFARSNQRPFLWVCDEAQNFFRTRQLRENMADLLTMSRSFGSFFLYLTQNLGTALQDGEMLETLHTNIRWSLTLRTTPREGGFLQTALPLTGRLEKPPRNPYAPPEFYSPSEERSLLLSSLAHLPDQTGWLWLKSLSGEAVRIKTKRLNIPTGKEYFEAVSRLRSDSAIGNRVSRDAYLAAIARRNAEYNSGTGIEQFERLKEVYQEQEIAE